jgi:hypothetical protein
LRRARQAARFNARMTVAEARHQLASDEEVVAWRYEQLVAGGYGAEEARALACRKDIDLHQALELVGRGCPHELAVGILL